MLQQMGERFFGTGFLANDDINPFHCHDVILKTTNKSAKSQTRKLFCLLFSRRPVNRISPKCTTLKADVIGLENVLFAGAYIHFLNPEILQAGAVKGLTLAQSARLWQLNCGLHLQQSGQLWI